MDLQDQILLKTFQALEPFFWIYADKIWELLFLNLTGSNKEDSYYEENLKVLLENKSTIIEILKVSHMEQFLIFSKRWKLEIISTILIHILEFHNKKIIHQLKQTRRSELFQFPVLSIYSQDRRNNISISVTISLKKWDMTVYAAYNINFIYQNQTIFVASFYVGKESIFLANLQFLTGSKDFLDFMKYHRMVIYILQKIAQEKRISRLYSYSNFLHPSKFWKEHDGFKWNYDAIAESLSLKIWEQGFYTWNIEDIKIKIPAFFKETIDLHLQKVLNLF